MNIKFYCLTSLLLLQGCTTSFDSKFSDKELYSRSPGVQSLESQKQKAFTKYSTAFLGKPVTYNARQQQLLAKKVSFHSEQPLSLNMVLDGLSQQARFSYQINTRLPGSGGNGSDISRSDAIKDSQVSFDGTFEELMRYLSALYDVSVSLKDDDILQVNLWNTYAIPLDFFGKDNEWESGLDFSGNSDTGGGVTAKSETKFKSTFWEEVNSLAQKYVSSGVWNMFQDVGVFTFSGRPSEYERLSRLLKEFKETSARQFVITYKVFILDKSKVRSLNGELGLAFKSGGTTVDLNSAFLQSDISSGLGVSRNFYSGGRLGITARLDALYQLTGGKMLQSGTMVTRNNTPVPLNLTNSKNYVSKISKVKSTGVVDINTFETQVDTSTLVTGTSVIMTPRVLSDGRIELVSAFTKKNLTSLDTFPSGGTQQEQVQLPNISTTELFNTVDVSPGSLIIVGQYDTDENQENQGLKLIGASTGGTDSKSTVVMVVGVDYYNKPFAEH